MKKRLKGIEEKSDVDITNKAFEDAFNKKVLEEKKDKMKLEVISNERKINYKIIILIIFVAIILVVFSLFTR